MHPLQAFVNAIGAAGRMERTKYHLTLGALIAALHETPDDMAVQFDNGTFPGRALSYRGYYDDLAFEPTDRPIRAGEFRAVCEAAIGKTFEGYKGGDYLMEADTPLWSALYGTCAGSLAIVGITSVSGAGFVLLTKQID